MSRDARLDRIAQVAIVVSYVVLLVVLACGARV